MHKTEGLTCPTCNGRFLDVIDSRSRQDGLAIRRRRVCQECGERVTTYETVAAPVGDMLPLIIALADELRDNRKQLTADDKRPGRHDSRDQGARRSAKHSGGTRCRMCRWSDSSP